MDGLDLNCQPREGVDGAHMHLYVCVTLTMHIAFVVKKHKQISGPIKYIPYITILSNGGFTYKLISSPIKYIPYITLLSNGGFTYKTLKSISVSGTL